jgi:hypothetical protein
VLKPPGSAVSVLMQGMLLIPADKLEARLAGLPHAFGISADDALRLAQDAPNILLVSSAKVAAAWKDLQRAAGLRAEWRQQVGRWHAAALVRYCGMMGLMSTQQCRDQVFRCLSALASK